MANRKRGCVVHYSHLVLEDENLRPLTNKSYERLVQSKNARLQLGGAHHHERQIKSIPDELIPGEHFVHRQCYQNFTKAVSVFANKTQKGKKISKKASPLKRKQRSKKASNILLPNICMICKSSRPIKVKGKKQPLKLIQTFSSCRTLQQAAALREDNNMLAEISGIDLIAKECKIHTKCYNKYTIICSKQSAALASTAVQDATDEVLEANEQCTTDFDSVCSYITNHVIGGNQSVSMKALTELYGFNKEDCRLRSKVKKRLEAKFGDSILFLTVSCREAQIVISKEALLNTTVTSLMKDRKEFITKTAAKLLRADIVDMIKQAPDLPWPPTAETLAWKERQPPESVKEFLQNLLNATHHTRGENVQRYVESFAHDLVHAVSRGHFLTEKHTLLCMGLHSLTGLKKPIEILGRFGHSCNYDQVRLIETAQAEVAQHLRALQNPLPLVPRNGTDSVLTFFWWDNFDVKKENAQGSLHTTHGIAYQEESNQSIELQVVADIPRSGRRAVSYESTSLSQRKIVPHKNPVLFGGVVEEEENTTQIHVDRLLLLWRLMRKVSIVPTQTVARFVGWVLQTQGTPDSKCTRITFLPPIRNPITEYSTIIECIKQSQRLASACNMTYAHITVDAGAAQKFYHVVWNCPEEFKNEFLYILFFHILTCVYSNNV